MIVARPPRESLWDAISDSAEKPITHASPPPTLLTPAAHAVRDCAGQLIGRTVGLAIYTGTYSLATQTLPVTFSAGLVGAVSGATLGCMLAAQQIPHSDPTTHFWGSLCCGLGGAVAGVTIVALGATQPVIALAIGGSLTAAVSLMRLCSQNPENDAAVDKIKGVAALIGTAATFTAVAVADHDWHTPNDIAARNLGVLGESLTVEFFKSTLERFGPSIDRQALTFNGKVLVSLAGTLPYVAATVFLNGVISGLFQPAGANDSHQFGEMILPTLIGALANAARGFANASACECLHEWNIGTLHPKRDLVRPHEGLNKPENKQMLSKTAIRFFISSCRNAVYTKLRGNGLSPVQAGIIAQVIYGFFAQNRDLIFDLMQGEGWVSAGDTHS